MTFDAFAAYVVVALLCGIPCAGSLIPYVSASFITNGEVEDGASSA